MGSHQNRINVEHQDLLLTSENPQNRHPKTVVEVVIDQNTNYRSQSPNLRPSDVSSVDSGLSGTSSPPEFVTLHPIVEIQHHPAYFQQPFQHYHFQGVHQNSSNIQTHSISAPPNENEIMGYGMQVQQQFPFIHHNHSFPADKQQHNFEGTEGKIYDHQSHHVSAANLIPMHHWAPLSNNLSSSSPNTLTPPDTPASLNDNPLPTHMTEQHFSISNGELMENQNMDHNLTHDLHEFHPAPYVPGSLMGVMDDGYDNMMMDPNHQSAHYYVDDHHPDHTRSYERKNSDAQNSYGRREKQIEVACDSCGKRYKNQICLQKHSWEHHQSWMYAKRLMLNKHQSVQIMEAAQALISMLSDPNPVDEADAYLNLQTFNDPYAPISVPGSPLSPASLISDE